jgi:cell division septum initiation protein DivIVA
MANESLQSRLAALRAELSGARELDEPTRRAVQQLADEVETLLAAPPTPPESLRERLGDRVRELEVAHPKLSATLGSIIDTLAFYGL